MITPPKKEYKVINAEFIIDPPHPNRVAIDPEELQALAQSINQIGLKEPLIVRPIGEKFEVVAGHRRFKASLMAGHINIECIVENLTDDQAEDVKAHENLFRQDLTPLEEALALNRLLATDKSNLPEIAKRRGKSEQWVQDRLDILTYPEYFWPALDSGQISLGVARWLAPIQDEIYRRMFFDSAVTNGMKVFQAETCYRQWEGGIFSPSDVIMPKPGEKNPDAPAPFRTECQKCLTMGEVPNIEMVWIHKQCPESEAGMGAAT